MKQLDPELRSHPKFPTATLLFLCVLVGIYLHRSCCIFSQGSSGADIGDRQPSSSTSLFYEQGATPNPPETTNHKII